MGDGLDAGYFVLVEQKADLSEVHPWMEDSDAYRAVFWMEHATETPSDDKELADQIACLDDEFAWWKEIPSNGRCEVLEDLFFDILENWNACY